MWRETIDITWTFIIRIIYNIWWTLHNTTLYISCGNKHVWVYTSMYMYNTYICVWVHHYTKEGERTPDKTEFIQHAVWGKNRLTKFLIYIFCISFCLSPNFFFRFFSFLFAIFFISFCYFFFLHDCDLVQFRNKIISLLFVSVPTFVVRDCNLTHR